MTQPSRASARIRQSPSLHLPNILFLLIFSYRPFFGPYLAALSLKRPQGRKEPAAGQTDTLPWTIRDQTTSRPHPCSMGNRALATCIPSPFVRFAKPAWTSCWHIRLPVSSLPPARCLRSFCARRRPDRPPEHGWGGLWPQAQAWGILFLAFDCWVSTRDRQAEPEYKSTKRFPSCLLLRTLSGLFRQGGIEHFNQLRAVIAEFLITVLLDHALNGTVDSPVSLFLAGNNQVAGLGVVIK